MNILNELEERIDAFPDVLNRQRRIEGATNAECAEATGISEPTISRFFGKQSKSPNFYAVVALAKKLRFSVDRYFNIEVVAQNTAEVTELLNRISALDAKISFLEDDRANLLHVLDRTREDLTEQKKAFRHLLMAFIGVIVLFLAAFVLCDLTNPDFGFLVRE